MRDQRKPNSAKDKDLNASKGKLHPRNRHRQQYDFKALITSNSELEPFVKENAYGNASIDFFNPDSVRALNKSLLLHYYDIIEWDIPINYLCPPIPGRADYIHYIADLLGATNHGKIPKGSHITCLDIGVGASCVYPIIGIKEYAWSFIGTDIDPVAIASAKDIVAANPILNGKVDIRHQSDPDRIFTGILKEGEYLDVVVCNPPFHRSHDEAQKGAKRKLKNLKRKAQKSPTLNFGGQNNELWREGGAQKFIQDMIQESKTIASSCFWFSVLVSQKSYLDVIYEQLRIAKVVDVKTIFMAQGNKTSQIIAWTFLNPAQRKQWRAYRWV